MKIVNLTQGTPEWHAHRAAHFNASDAPAMMGVSPYKTRAQLLREYATGITPEVDAATQRRFDEGHRLEAQARPYAENIIGEELYPCVGVNGRLSASFDGLTLLYDTAFEHKMMNGALREVLLHMAAPSIELPDHYRVQMEQQCMVSGAERVLFVASAGEGESAERYHCWYTPDPDLRARIVAGWDQFERDLQALRDEIAAGNLPAVAAPPAVGSAPEQLPALRIEITGMVTASNLEAFKVRALQVFREIPTDLQTDQDFANAEETVKWCGDIEDRLATAKAAALAQTESIDALFRAIDEISGEARAKRLALEKLVKARKEAVRAEIVDRARQSVVAHIRELSMGLGEHALGIPASLAAEIGAAIKGKKTLTSITDAAETAAAAAKIAATQQAERVRANIAVLEASEGEHSFLFLDRVALCTTKTPEDLRNLARARIDEYQERERQRAAAAAEKASAEAALSATLADMPPAPPPAARREPPPSTDGRTIKLGEINARIAPLSVNADGLASLGIVPVGNERAAKLYAEADFPAICEVLIGVLRAATTTAEA